DLALFSYLGGRLRFFNDLAHRLLCLFGQHVERAVPGLVRRTLGALHPLAVLVAVEVIPAALAGGERVGLDTGGQLGIGAHAVTLFSATDTSGGCFSGKVQASPENLIATSCAWPFRRSGRWLPNLSSCSPTPPWLAISVRFRWPS